MQPGRARTSGLGVPLLPLARWIVIAKQHCVCAMKELRNERFGKGLDTPQWMQVVKVNLLKTETKWAT